MLAGLFILLPSLSPAKEKEVGKGITNTYANAPYNKLTDKEARVVLRKGTEYPRSGKHNTNKEKGIYTCKQCDLPLFDSKDKFDSGTGWPSFDDQLQGGIKEVRDADGRRVELVCSNCGGHLGHVFRGERMTRKNTRHCINSVSLSFVPRKTVKRALFASGCFWGTEYLFKKKKGVLTTTVGYTGGHARSPSSKDVGKGKTGHAEAIEVIYDPSKVSYEELTRLFFEIHDPTQVNRQGPDVGEEYRSEIFYLDDKQKETGQKLIDILKEKGFKIATRLTRASDFWPAEEGHQDYYDRKGGTPYCHFYSKRF
ncbi:MAG: bifunctional methionine sulfoxide reductase B/A protein [bacterium]|nr:bifunctional methionine sulfoxide reductase B/A protein [bacterium]